MGIIISYIIGALCGIYIFSCLSKKKKCNTHLLVVWKYKNEHAVHNSKVVLETITSPSLAYLNCYSMFHIKYQLDEDRYDDIIIINILTENTKF